MQIFLYVTILIIMLFQLLNQKLDRFDRVRQNLFGRLVPVRKARRIAKINIVILGQRFDKGFGNDQPAKP